MFRFASLALVFAGSAAIAASAPVLPQGLTVDAQLRQARAEAAAATAEQQRLEKLAAEAHGEVGRLQAAQLAAAQAIAAAEAQISAADAEAQLARVRLELQRQRLARKQAPVSSLLGGLYLTSQRPPLLLLAETGSTEELLKLRALVSEVAPVVQARTAALSSELQSAERLQAVAIAAHRRMVDSRDELSRRRDAFAALEAQAIEVAQRTGSQALGAGDIALARSETVSAAEQAAQSARESARVARELAKVGPAPLPLAPPARSPALAYRLPADAPVAQGLGTVDANGVRSRGVTLATRRGTPLEVPATGTILFAGPFRDYDGVIILDHASGWKSVLVNAGTRLRRGDRVKIGEPLGIALGAVEVQLLKGGEAVSPALIAGSSAIVSKERKSG